MKTHVSYRNFTTTLPESMLAELSRAAKELSVQKNDILIDAFAAWSRARTQEQLAQSYAIAATDSEYQSLAEEGLSESTN